MQEQLEQQRQRLETQRQNLQNLQSQRQEQNQTPIAGYSTQINSNNASIRDFIEELNSYDRSEAEINRRADDALKQQSSEAQVARDQIDAAIRIQESVMRQTQEEWTYWQYNQMLSQRQAREQELLTLMETQRQDLENLRAQRLELSSQILLNSQAVQAQKDQALSDLSQNRQSLQDEISLLRDEVYRLQEDQYRTRTSQVSLGSQIQQAQRTLQQQQNQVDTLEKSMQQKADELNMLR